MSLARRMLAELGLASPFPRSLPVSAILDLQGWASDHPYFSSLVEETRPALIIEVGTWKGASAINMAKAAREIRADVTVLCVDTWLGSNEVLWSDPALRPLLALRNGIPQVYQQFLANIVLSDLTDTVFPMPMTSTCAAALLSRFSIAADLIYVDAGHSEREVYGDLIHFWPLVRTGGVLFGDDYWTTWDGVIKAVNRFAHEPALPLETSAGKWVFRKGRVE
jgi:Methyltransferase domain